MPTPGRLRHAAVRVRGPGAPGAGRRASSSSSTRGRRGAPGGARVARRRGRVRRRRAVPGRPARRLDARSRSTRSPPAGSAEFYAFAADVLRGLRATHVAGRRAFGDHPLARALRHRFRGRPRGALGRRANYGASPGDERPSRALPLRRSVAAADRAASSGTRPRFDGAELGYARARRRRRPRRLAAPISSPPAARRSPTEPASRPPRRVSWPRAIRRAHRRRRLPRPQRGHPGDRPQGRSTCTGTRSSAFATAGAGRWRATTRS